MSNSKVKRLAKANIILLEEAKDSREFVKLFNRNFSKRIHEHLKLVENVVANIKNIKSFSDNSYNSLNENLSKQDIKDLVQEQLKAEIKKRQNIKLLEKHTGHINELFGLFSVLNNVLSLKEKALVGKINKSCKLMTESLKSGDVNNVFESYKNVVDIAISTSTKSLLATASSSATMFNDLGTLAAVSLRTIKESAEPKALEWWRNTLLLKENEFRTPKDTIIKLQKILLETESKLFDFNKQIEDARI